MDSQEQSNPLLVDDPSIVQISSREVAYSQPDGEKKNTNKLTMETLFRDSKNERKNPLQDLETGDAISKLLDSAMANAAKNENMEKELDTSIESPSNDSLHLRKAKDPELTYSIEFLMSLKDSPHIPSFEGKLPEKSFWKINKKNQNQNEFKHNRKNSFTNKKNNNNPNNSHQSESWDRKHAGSAFFKTNDLDSLSPDKISQLLGESNEDVIPEWDSSDLGNDYLDNLGGMGQTVEDFEKWKSHMKSEERRKNGETFDENVSNDLAAEKAGNEVDSFFSFVKPKPADPKVRSSSVSSTSTKTPNLPSSEISGRSSKFSSFFAPTKEVSSPKNTLSKTQSHDPDTLKAHPDRPQGQPSIAQFQEFQLHQQQLDQQQEHLQHQQHQMEEQQKHPFPPNSPGQQAPPIFSRFFNQPIPETNENTPRHKGPNPPPGFPQEHNENARSGPPSNHADSFFMSLLNKKEPEGENAAIKSPKNPLNALFNKTNPQSTKKSSNEKPPQKPNNQGQRQQSQPSQAQQVQQQQQQQHYQPNPSGQQGNGPQHNQQLPPWMKQFQNGMPPMPPPPHMQFPPNFQGNPNFQGGPPGNNGHPNQHQGPPPPGMFPNGMFPNGMPPPPRGMQLPPHQFVNGNPNGPYPPPQFMGMPPGMPPQLQKQNSHGSNVPQQQNPQQH